MYYAYDTPQGKKAIVDHTNDARQGFHTHAGQPSPNIQSIYERIAYDFKDPNNTYYPVGGVHHIYYK